MIVSAVVLVALALVVMRALMAVVAREERTTPAPTTVLEPTVPGGPAPELRARADDGVRAFLMPAAEPDIVGSEPARDDRAVRERSARS